MSQVTSLRVLRDHLGLTPEGKPRRRKQISLEILFLLFSLLIGLLIKNFGVETDAVGALLTATSILTGLTFTMALRFWERSIDARSNVDLMFDNERKSVLDKMRTLLLWTVLAGILSTAWLAALAVVIGTGTASSWATGIAAALLTYQLMYVVRSLLELYWASYTLRP